MITGDKMKAENIKKFELNRKVLDNFDSIMSTKLDEIEELKITGLDKKSKLLNIISLCANVKTLIIEGDQRIDSDKVLMNLFKPEKLENLILNNVKLPTKVALKRYENLKMISLNQIRFCQVKDFLDGIINPHNIEIINICDTEMNQISIQELEKFKNIKYLCLDNLKKCELNNLEFLKLNNNLLKISILNNQIYMHEINHLLKCNCRRDINVDIVNSENEIIENGKLVMNEKNETQITFSVESLAIIAKEVNLHKLSKINVVINHMIEDIDSIIKILKRFKKNTNIIIKGFSSLNAEQAQQMKDSLKIEKINRIDDNLEQYDIDTYINMRTEINNIIQDIPKKTNEPQKFLQIYKCLGRQFNIVEGEIIDFKNKIFGRMQISQILKDCLECINIQSNIISGEDINYNREHCWNQVFLEGQWYNLDLALDMNNIKKNKTEYCLLGDKEFLETHIPKSGKNYYCPNNFNHKFIKTYLKRGSLKEKILNSCLKVTFEKIKKIFKLKKKQQLLNAPDNIGDNNLEK